jgi:hypothetical protein
MTEGIIQKVFEKYTNRHYGKGIAYGYPYRPAKIECPRCKGVGWII